MARVLRRAVREAEHSARTSVRGERSLRRRSTLTLQQIERTGWKRTNSISAWSASFRSDCPRRGAPIRAENLDPAGCAIVEGQSAAEMDHQARGLRVSAQDS